MNLACVGTAFCLLIFESIQFAKDFHGHADMVVTESVQAIRIVKEDIGIENEVFAKRRGGFQAIENFWARFSASV